MGPTGSTDREACAVCGFEWDAVGSVEIPERLRAAAAGWATVLAGDPDALSTRPAPATWSAVEYGCHVRDVLLNLRDRIVLGLAVEHPSPHSMYADARIEHGLYAQERPDRLATELGIGADLLARTVEALDDERLTRTLVYGWPRQADRTLTWVAAQALHEAEHHLDDARQAATR